MADIFICEDELLITAIERMDTISRKLLIVTDKHNAYKTLLSIGDVQRHLINNQDFKIPIKNILRPDREVIVVKEEDTLEEVKQVMLEHRTEFMPVLNNKGELVKIHYWEDIFNTAFTIAKGNLDLPVVIMAGGKGTRLKPITNIIPKPLIPLGEKPMIEIIADRFVQMGATQFYASVNYKAEMIVNHFENILDKTYNISFFTEDKPLGTAGSLSLLKNKINSTFFVSNCDILIDQDFTEVYNYHTSNNNELTLIAAIKQYGIPYGTIEVDINGNLKALKEKPQMTYLVNAGLYIIEPHLLDEIPENEFYHITHLIEKITERNGKVGVFPVSEGSWHDIGEWKQYKATLENYGYQLF